MKQYSQFCGESNGFALPCNCKLRQEFPDLLLCAFHDVTQTGTEFCSRILRPAGPLARTREELAVHLVYRTQN